MPEPATPPAPVLEVRARKTLGSFGLDAEVSLGREILALIGPSGSGKSLTLGCVAGFHRMDGGRIVLAGRVLADPAAGVHLKPERRRVGYVLQDPFLFPHMSVRRNLRYGCPGSRWSREAGATERGFFDELVEVLGLGDLLSRDPSTLSGGERQRVAIGRALMAKPDVLLMDEPVRSLDPAARWRVLRHIRGVHERFGTPVLYVTHSMEEVELLADSVAVLEQGRVVAQGSREEMRRAGRLFSIPLPRPYENLLPATVVKGPGPGGRAVIRVAGKELRVSAVDGPPGTSLLVSLSSADVILSRDHPAEMSTENIYCGRVKAVFPAREGALVLLDAGFDLYAQVSSEALQRLPVREGGELHYILRDGALRVHEEPLQGQVIAPFNSDEPRTPPQ